MSRADAEAESARGGAELAAALGALAEAPSAQARESVWRCLLEGELLCALAGPVQAREPAMDETAPVEPAVDFLSAPDSKGTPSLLAFTDVDAFRRFGLSDTFAIASAVELIAFAAAKGIASLTLDAAGPVGVTLEEWELAALAERRLPTSEDEARFPRPRSTIREMQVAAPVLPVEEHLLTTLRGALADDERVEAAYLFDAKREGLRRKLVVGLDVTHSTAPQELERLARSLLARLDPLVGAHTSLHFTRVEHDDLLTELARETPPVYTRRPE